LALVVGVSKAEAVADIAISSAVINSSNTVLVSFSDPGASLATVTATNWHIDVGGGGSTPLTPTSAVVTSATAPWTVLTFSGSPFSNTGKTYSASEGLYADDQALSDGADTNTIVAHSASIAITDGQRPTFTTVRTALNTFVLTFSESVTSGGVDTDSFTVSGATTVSAGVVVDGKITLTTTGLTNMSSKPIVSYVVATGDVMDVASNEVANGPSTTGSSSPREDNGGVGGGCSAGNLFNAATGAPCVNNGGAQIPGCGNRTTGFSTAFGVSCANNRVATEGAPNAPGASGYNFGTGSLKQGTKSEACRVWQTFLNVKKNADLVVDGNCGPRTIGAAKAWQKANGLTADGVLGAMSRGKALMQ
jgi:hypothetical protein